MGRTISHSLTALPSPLYSSAENSESGPPNDRSVGRFLRGAVSCHVRQSHESPSISGRGRRAGGAFVDGFKVVSVLRLNGVEAAPMT